MSSEHAAAVRNSNLYEYKGVAKSLLERIASLILDDPEWVKAQKYSEDTLGWCISRQETLAAWHGISVDTVCKLTQMYEADGWLKVKRFHDDRGYLRCWYTITKEQLAAIKARAMAKDEDDEFIRAKLPSRGARKSEESRQKSLVNLDAAKTSPEQPLDKKSKGLSTRSPEATRQEVEKPLDKKSIHSSGVPSFITGEENTSASSQNPVFSFSSSMKEGKPKATATAPVLSDGVQMASATPAPSVPACPRPRHGGKVVLKSEVVETLLAHGCPRDLIETLQTYTHIATILNGEGKGESCTNVLTAYMTFANHNPEFLAYWNPGCKFETFAGRSHRQVEERRAEFARKSKLTPQQADDEQDREDAMWWWVDLTIEQRKPFESGLIKVRDEYGMAEMSAIEIWRRERESCQTEFARMWRRKRDKKRKQLEAA